MINHKRQLELMKNACLGFQYDKVLGNALNEYDKGHQDASKKNVKDFIEIIDMALKGELSELDEDGDKK